jgi:membrane protein implicated in regulation of membrane protease activity
MSYQATAGLYVIFAAVVFALTAMLMLHFIVSYLRRRETERRNRVSDLRRREKELISTGTGREGGVVEDAPKAHRKKLIRERSSVSVGDRTAGTEELEPVLPYRTVHLRGPRRSARDLLRSRE